MAKISLAYPDTWLTISISVKNRDTWTEDFSGTMTEVWTTREYKYDFTEVVDTDYVYVATVTGYSPMSGVIYRVGGGLTTEQDEKLTQIDSRVDQTVSTLWSGILYNRNNYFDYGKLNTSLEELKKEIRKEIKSIEPTDTTDIIEELENIKKKLAAKPVEIKKIDLKQETDKILELLKKQAQKEEAKEKKEQEKQTKEQKEIMDTLEEIEERLSEIDTIEKEIDKEELNNILKLLK